MGIEGKIEGVEIDFEDSAGRDEITIKEHVGDEKNNQRIIKIEISTAIFIYRQYIEKAHYVTVDVIPFHQVKSCTAVIAGEENEITPSFG